MPAGKKDVLPDTLQNDITRAYGLAKVNGLLADQPVFNATAGNLVNFSNSTATTYSATQLLGK